MKKDGPLQVPIINLPQTIRKVFGEKGSDDFVGVLNDIQDAQIHRTIQRVEDKFELRLVAETAKLDKHITAVETKLEQESAKLHERISTVETRLDHRITEESVKLNNRISSVEIKLEKVQFTLIKWMFIFWVGQVAITIGIIQFALK